MVIFCSDPPRLVKFKYIADIPLWEIEKPYAIDQVENVCDGMISNLQYEEHESESLHDLRGSEDQLNIFDNSFAYIKHPTDLINPISTLSGKPPVLRPTKHWYLPLDKYQPWRSEEHTSELQSQ